MSESTISVEKLEKQIRVLQRKLERSEWHRVDLENQHDRDQHLYRRLQADLEAAKREAEIEAALERIRAQSMGMEHSSELVATSAVFHEQLLGLGIPTEFSYVWLPDEAAGKHQFWATWTEDQDGEPVHRSRAIMYDLDKSEPYTAACFAAWESDDRLLVDFILPADIAGFFDTWEELIGNAEHLSPERFPDGLYYAEGYMDYGCFGINIRREPTAEEQDVLQRFAIEFERAYTRFLDLRRAETQAREAEIEASLERIRARAMAMRSSDELREMVLVILSEMKALAFPSGRCTIVLFDRETGDSDFWISGLTSDALPERYHVPYHELPTYKALLGGWRQRTPFFEIELAGEIKREQDRFFHEETEFSRLPERAKEGMRSFGDIWLSNASTTHGVVQAVGPEPLTEEKAAILQRFAKVIDLTYTRVEDIQQSEAQVREAEIETALERVRSRAMSMQSSNELGALSFELVKQVRALGVDTWHCAFNIYDEGEESSTEWGANADGYYPIYKTPRIGIFRRYYEIGKTGRDLHVEEIGEDRAAAHYEQLCALPGVGEVLSRLRDSGVQFPTHQIDHVAYFKYGYLIFITYEPAPEAHELFKRFARVFEQAYTRFLDLKQAEARQREAQIEAAMERVRSRALAMTSSEELLDVVFKIRKEFAGLGLECGAFWHTRYTPEYYQKALTSIDGQKLAAVMDLPRDFASNPDLAAWEHGDEPIGVFTFDADAGAEYVHHMATKGKFSEIDPEAITEEMVREHGGLTFVQARTSHGEIGYSLWGEAEPSEEAKDVLVRFTSAFDLAYRRFEDLQQAEADHRALLEEKALTEQALEELRATQAQLVQSEKMASLGALTAGIAHEIKNPLNFVNNFAGLSRELAEDLEEETDPEERLALLADLKQNVAKIEEHGRRADAIVRGMMEHARGGSGERRPTAINKLVEEYAAHALHAAKVRHPHFSPNLVLDLAAEAGTVDIAPQDIGRVLINLIDNALDATRRHAEGAADGYVATVTVSTRRAANGAEVHVSDNGPGMAPEIRNKVFEPFFTTKPTGEGTGLGLSLAYDIVTQGHGGALTVESDIGEGAKFTLVLPVAAT